MLGLSIAGEERALLESIAAVIAIITAIVTGGIATWKWRHNRIESNRRALVGSWSNEGVVIGPQPQPLQLEIYQSHGEMVGQAYPWSNPNVHNRVDMNISPGVFSSKVRLSQVHGRTVTELGTARIKVTSYPRRIYWCINGRNQTSLPPKEELWL